MKFIANSDCKLCVMHSLGILPSLDNVLKLDAFPIDLIAQWGIQMMEKLLDLGFSLDNIILDPGIGFGKTVYQNIALLSGIGKLKELKVPILVGHSRKSYMEAFSKWVASERDLETIAMSLILKREVDFLRVHNVKDHMRAFLAQDVFLYNS